MTRLGTRVAACRRASRGTEKKVTTPSKNQGLAEAFADFPEGSARRSKG